MPSPRGYDEQLRKQRIALGYRVDEDVPHCWMCASAAHPRTNEHVFPVWMLNELGLADKRVDAVHHDRFGMQISKRGPVALSSLVNGQVCEQCNHGWMSRLEVEFRSLFLGPRSGRLDEAARRTIARWFAKTAVVLNTSQNYRLLYPDGVRHQLRKRVPTNARVWLGRRPANEIRRIEWAQTSTMGASVVAATAALERLVMRADQWSTVAIEVGDLVGLVTYTPGGTLWPNADLAPLWPSVTALGWETVPVTAEPVETLLVTNRSSLAR